MLTVTRHQDGAHIGAVWGNCSVLTVVDRGDSSVPISGSKGQTRSGGGLQAADLQGHEEALKQQWGHDEV